MSTYSTNQLFGIPGDYWGQKYPKVPHFFEQVVAGDNTTFMTDFTSWVPQVMIMIKPL